MLSFSLVIAFGAMMMFDMKGVRTRFTKKPGESEEYVKKFQVPAIIVGAVFFFLPLSAIIHSIFR
ncbi:hypothetical protein [Streptomyces sp. NPDC096068]|uniref:hypothetical protein n=1 Tax=Streptomyces sp. NPDC096068 TaxID=3155424 RepID=UPI003326FA69